MGKINISYDELYEFYIVLGNTIEITATHFGCDSATIKNYLQEFHISKGRSLEKINIDKKELYNYYIVQNLSIEECAEIFRCSNPVIIRRLRKYGIKKQVEAFTEDELYMEYILNNHTVSECMEIFKCTRWMIESRITKFGMYKPKEMIRRAESRLNILFDDLYEYYIYDNHTKKESAKHFNCSVTRIGDLIHKYGIIKKKSYKSINKDELYNFYITENHSYKETAKHFMTSIPSISRACRYYGIKKDRSLVADISDRTKRINHTYGKSKPEDNFYNYLCEKYGSDNVFRQYEDDRYPFLCDFYIKTTDVFVELNLFWTHGGAPFDDKNPEHINTLKTWEKRGETHPHYLQAINTWTIRDPLKIKTAIKNNIKYVTYYNKDDLYDGRV